MSRFTKKATEEVGTGWRLIFTNNRWSACMSITDSVPGGQPAAQKKKKHTVARQSVLQRPHSRGGRQIAWRQLGGSSCGDGADGAHLRPQPARPRALRAPALTPHPSARASHVSTRGRHTHARARGPNLSIKGSRASLARTTPQRARSFWRF